MTDPITQTLYTISGSVVVFVIGQLISKAIVEPIQELRRVIGETHVALAFHRAAIFTPAARSHDTSKAAHEALLKSSAELATRVHMIPAYGFFSGIFRRYLPRKAKILDAATTLRGLSTYVHETGPNAEMALESIRQRVTRIEKDLGLPSMEEEPLYRPN